MLLDYWCQAIVWCPDPVMVNFQLDHKKKTLKNFLLPNVKIFIHKNSLCDLKMLSANASHFVQASMCNKQLTMDVCRM